MNIGKLLIYAGLGLAAVGVLFMAASKLGIRFFRLPGDIVWKPTENSTVYFPIVTSIVLSILLTLILWEPRFKTFVSHCGDGSRPPGLLWR